MALKTVYASKDASAREQGDAWSGWDLHHPVGMSSGGNRYRPFIYFPISFTGMTTITNAKLWIRGHRPGSGFHVQGAASGSTRTLSVRRVTADWGEGVDRGETSWSSEEFWGWTTRAEESSVTNIATRVFTGYVHDTWYDIDVTGIVNDWFGGSPNYGFLMYIGGDDTDSTKALEFWARDSGASNRPYLEITYNENTVPNAPTGLSPTANQLVNTLSPTLLGTRSDPDSGDYITAYQIRLYLDNGTTLKWDSGTVTQTGTSITFSKVYAGPPLEGNTFYKWQARTRDKGGLWGTYSALQRFEANTAPNPPTLSITQSPDSDILTLTPTINITHSDNDIGDSKMYGYRAVVSSPTVAGLWDSGDVDTSGAPVTTTSIVYAGPALSWATRYTYSGRTKDSNGVWGPYETKSFTTHATAVPVSLSPSGESANLVPTFEGVRGHNNDTLTSYQIILYAADGVTQIWDSGVLTTNIASGASFSKLYTGTALTLGTSYKWKARVTASVGGTSAYSALQTFTTLGDATTLTLSYTPVTNGKVTSLTPTLTGSRASAFTNYTVEVYPETSTSANLGTAIFTDTVAQSSATSFNKVYNGPALAWSTTYKWRARVNSPAQSAWTGLQSFTTDIAATPTLTAPADNSWFVPVATNFTGTSSETINAYQIQIFESNGTTLVYDSGVIGQANAGSFSRSIDLTLSSTFPAGATYLWKARVQKSTGPMSPWAPAKAFRLNGAPLIPTGRFPSPGYAFSGTLFPTFKATFVDQDESTNGDTPTSWEIEIRNNATDALIQTKTLTTGLLNAQNSYVWGTNTGGADTALAYGVIYKWRTRFTDSKSAAGAWSSYTTFFSGEPPTISNLIPTNGSNIATVRPLVDWDFSDPASLAMEKFTIRVIRAVNGTVVYSKVDNVSSVSSFQIPAGYLQYNGEDYTFEVTAQSTSGLTSNTLTSTVTLLLDAPPPIDGLSATVFEDRSFIFLHWTPTSLATNFVTYVIYRRDIGDTDWTMIGTRKPETSGNFYDYYAGMGRQYEYRVTVVKKITDEPDIESPDSDIVTAQLVSDVWMVVGKDRAEEHIFELPVSEESHTRPVQQETFEPLGSNRKAIVRGFVLGHEGSITLTFDQSESREGREKIEYLMYYAGPHILKNPFGDVFDVTFAGPDYQYVGGGHLETTLTWVEVGATNNPGLSPDEFLAQIGAE